MNKETVQKIKEFYENKIRTQIAEGLSCNEQQVKATWSIEQSNATVDVSQQDKVIVFNFTYTPENKNLVVEGQTYGLLFTSGAQPYINGIQNLYAQIDYETMTKIKEAFEAALNDEYCESDPETCADCAEETSKEEETSEQQTN